MTGTSGAAWFLGFSAAVFLNGCTSSEDPRASLQANLQQKVASPTASCSGYVRAFGDAPSQATALSCSGAQHAYVAYADTVDHRFSPCAFTFEPSSNSKGAGTMACSNGASGPLTYDIMDPANIKVAATLDDGRQMAFTLKDE
ncbi:MAG: hypothetical protein R3D05_13410 [Dongiaceae bacterium]